MFQDKKVLVTGGAGFIGSNLVEELVRQGAKVTVLDNLSATNDVVCHREGIEFIRGSVNDSSISKTLVEKKDIVFHLASRVISKSVNHPEEDFMGTLMPIFTMLCACKNQKLSRLVYSSSSSVYGVGSHFPIVEDSIFRPLTPYAASKIAGEMYCRAFRECYGIPFSVVRCSNVYGPGQSARNPNCGMVAKFISAALHDEPIQIHGDGSQTRDFTYVGDAVRAILLAATSEKAIGEVFNVGTGIETSVNKMATLVKQLTGSKIIPTFLLPRYMLDDIDRRVVCIDKARRRLGWTPEVSLEEGIQKTIDWFRSMGG